MEGFAQTDEAIVKISNEEGWMNGSTGVAGVIVDHKLYIANVGDSEACLVSEEDGELKAENLTTPHKANDPTEKKRVEELGGHVFFGRVFGALAVSRSFGDSKFKKPKTSQNFVSCEPALHTSEILPHHKFMILACDGLWDVMNHLQAAKFVQEKIKAGQNAKEVAHSLVQEALNKKTEDNVTVIIVIFKHSVSENANSVSTPPKPHPLESATIDTGTPVTSPVPAEDAPDSAATNP